MKNIFIIITLLIVKTSFSQKKLTTIEGEQINFTSYNIKKGIIYYYQINDSILEKKVKLKNVILLEDNNTIITNKELITSSFEKNDNFTLGLGAGNSYGNVGVQLQWHSNKFIHSATHIGIGKTSKNTLLNLGYKIYPYKIFYIDFDIGGKGWEEKIILEDSSVTYILKTIYGSSIMAGIDITGSKKKSFGFNLGIGYTKHFNSDFTPSTVAFSVGILYRISKWKK